MASVDEEISGEQCFYADYKPQKLTYLKKRFNKAK